MTTEGQVDPAAGVGEPEGLAICDNPLTVNHYPATKESVPSADYAARVGPHGSIELQPAPSAPPASAGDKKAEPRVAILGVQSVTNVPPGRRPQTCNTCGKEGHFSRACGKREKGGRSGGSNGHINRSINDGLAALKGAADALEEKKREIAESVSEARSAEPTDADNKRKREEEAKAEAKRIGEKMATKRFAKTDLRWADPSLKVNPFLVIWMMASATVVCLVALLLLWQFPGTEERDCRSEVWASYPWLTPQQTLDLPWSILSSEVQLGLGFTERETRTPVDAWSAMPFAHEFLHHRPELTWTNALTQPFAAISDQYERVMETYQGRPFTYDLPLGPFLKAIACASSTTRATLFFNIGLGLVGCLSILFLWSCAQAASFGVYAKPAHRRLKSYHRLVSVRRGSKTVFYATPQSDLRTDSLKRGPLNHTDPLRGYVRYTYITPGQTLLNKLLRRSPFAHKWLTRCLVPTRYGVRKEYEVSYELVAQASDFRVLRPDATFTQARARIIDTMGAITSVNIDRYLAPEGRAIIEGSAMMVAAQWFHNQYKLRHADFA